MPSRTGSVSDVHPSPAQGLRLDGVRTVHLLGVCGAGLRALAEVLADRGVSVSGCDLNPDPIVTASLHRRGIVVCSGHDEQHLPPQLDWCVASAALPSDHPELQAARGRGAVVLTYVEALARLVASGEGLAVAGTHGKSTTTLMLAAIFAAAGRSPTVCAGAEDVARERHGWAGVGPWRVVEACEFRRHFLQLRPRAAAITSIELDHVDCYPHLAALESSFRSFVQQLPRDGWLAYAADCETTRRVAQSAPCPTLSWSLAQPDADWFADSIEDSASGVRFQLQHLGRRSKASLRVPGTHNVQNALAAAALASGAGVEMSAIVNGLAEFSGARRRFERISRWAPQVVIDDYAHHPSEIRAVLKTGRACWPDRALHVFFQPHQASRTWALMDDFADALSLADEVTLLPVFAAREQPGSDGARAVMTLMERLSERGASVRWAPTLDRVRTVLETGAAPASAEVRDVIFTLGAGDLTRVHYDFA